MQKQYLIIIEGGEEGRNYAAYSPDVDGCVATGKTVGETIDNMRSALRFHLEGMLLHGEELPESASGISLYVNVPVPTEEELAAIQATLDEWQRFVRGEISSEQFTYAENIQRLSLQEADRRQETVA